MSVPRGEPECVIGRYSLYDQIGAGGMATVHLGRMAGPVGFTKTVAIKRLRAELAEDPDVVAMFLDEVRLAARVQHPNVVSTFDAICVGNKDKTDGRSEVLLVMDFVRGVSLAALQSVMANGSELVPLPIALRIVTQMLYGLHAAHQATDERGAALEIVHRDVSPQNVMVGADGGARLMDFGIAKAVWRVQTTRDGQLKGKIAYMSPEHVTGAPIDRRGDVFSAAIVLWELATGRRLFKRESPVASMHAIVGGEVLPPSQFAKDLPDGFDEIVVKALAVAPEDRFDSALDFAEELMRVGTCATEHEVASFLRDRLADRLRSLDLLIERMSPGPATFESVPSDMQRHLDEAVLAEEPTRLNTPTQAGADAALGGESESETESESESEGGDSVDSVLITAHQLSPQTRRNKPVWLIAAALAVVVTLTFWGLKTATQGAAMPEPLRTAERPDEPAPPPEVTPASGSFDPEKEASLPIDFDALQADRPALNEAEALEVLADLEIQFDDDEPPTAPAATKVPVANKPKRKRASARTQPTPNAEPKATWPNQTRKKTVSKRPRPAPTDSCSPNYVIGVDGVKRFKLECL